MPSDNTDRAALDRRTFLGVTGAGLFATGLASSTGVASDDGGDGGPPTDGGDGDDHEHVATVTLVTGDRVHVSRVDENDGWTASVDPADRGDYEPSFDVEEHEDAVYVIPTDAAPLIPDTLDRELFNIVKLVEVSPRTDDGTIPTIVTSPDPAAAGTMNAAAGVRATRQLSSIGGSAVTLDGDEFWTASTDDVGGLTAGGPLNVDGKIWLDEPVTAELHDSVDRIGAPAAWDAGYDGSDTTIAVLDTGIDESHEDIGDKVVAAEDFTGDGTTDDLYGHGTHVAATAAGTGDASDGDRTGVAHGADLVNGRVLDENGSGTESGIIAGMEWAAAEQDVDVVNMSLGAGATDGTDPLSQAVDNLTAEHDTVFVISAGNSGPSDQSVTSPAPADEAIAVGAVDKDGELASFSSRGPRVGDYAVKPEITAPGVDIVAARADDTDMGSPVDEDYTQASGTSMAAPHVAGAAAIVRQRHPDWDSTTVRSALSSTAGTNDELSVYEQGGGELDAAAVAESDVVATPAPVNLGYHEYPHDDAEPVTETLTLANGGDEAVDLELSVDLTDEDGDSPADGMVTVEPSAVTVDPGESESVEVTLDLEQGETGLYGGWLTVAEGDETVATVPAGFYKEPEVYELTVEGYMADGRTARRSSYLDVMNVDDRDEFYETSVGFTDGVATVRVPAGTYRVAALITTLDQDDAFFDERTAVVEPEVEVTDDTHVVLDAGEANDVVLDSMHDVTERTDGSIGYSLADAQGGRFTRTASGDTPVSAVPSDQAITGDFELFTEHTLVKPSLITRATEPETLEVDGEYMTDSPELEEGEYEWDLVPAGLGYPEDFDDVDVDGEMALIERGGFSFADKAINAYEAGAEAVIIYNNEPGDLNGTLSGDGVIPTFQLSQSEGQALLDLAEGGDARFEVAATPLTPFQYELLLPEADAIPEDLHYDIGEGDVGTIDAGYYSDVPDKEINISHANWRPYQTVAITFTDRDRAPQERTEYVSANDTRWQKTVYKEPAFDGSVQEPQTFYEGGEHREKVWHKQVSSPGLIEGTEHHPSFLPVRDGDTLDLTIPEWSDAQTGDHRHWGWSDLDDETAFRLYEDGDLVHEDDRANDTFAVSDESRIRLELDVARDADWWETSTETATAWEFDSESTDGTEPLPLVMVDYDTELDLRNRVPHPSDRNGPFTIDLHARHPRGVDGAEIDGMRVWTSYDDGSSWRERSVRNRGDGHFTVNMDRRNPPSDHLSLRVEAWDADGNRIEQEITRAYGLTPRN